MPSPSWTETASAPTALKRCAQSCVFPAIVSPIVGDCLYRVVNDEVCKCVRVVVSQSAREIEGVRERMGE